MKPEIECQDCEGEVYEPVDLGITVATVLPFRAHEATVTLPAGQLPRFIYSRVGASHCKDCLAATL